MKSFVLASLLAVAAQESLVSDKVLNLPANSPFAIALAKSLPEIVEQHDEFAIEWGSKSQAYLVGAASEAYLISCSFEYRIGRLPEPKKAFKGCSIEKAQTLTSDIEPMSLGQFLGVLGGSSL